MLYFFQLSQIDKTKLYKNKLVLYLKIMKKENQKLVAQIMMINNDQFIEVEKQKE